MTLSALVLQIIILLLPGFVWVLVEQETSRTGTWSNAEKLVRAIFYGLFSYVLLYFIYTFFEFSFSLLDLEEGVNKNSLNLFKMADEILFSVPVAFVLSLIWVKFKNIKLLTFLAGLLKVSKKYGNEDVWEYVFNSDQAFAEYIHYRDHENKLMYCGWVDTFSDETKPRELLLRDVKVYDFEGEFLWDSPKIYLARIPECFDIDFPYKKEESNE